jgi:hypothetical protein
MDKKEELKYKKAAKKVVKQIDKHFTTRGHGWPLAYSLYKEDIFWEVNGKHLESYFLQALAESKINYVLESGNTGLVIKKSTKKKPVKGEWTISIKKFAKQVVKK